MCAYYWNLKGVTFTCPVCGHKNEDATLQTHFTDKGYCTEYYALGERVPFLGNMTVTLGKDGPDDFIENCTECGTFLDFGAEIVKGAVVRVWPETPAGSLA